MPPDKKTETTNFLFVPVTQLFINTESGKKGWVKLYAMTYTDEENQEEAVKLVKEQIQKGIEAMALLSKLEEFYDKVKQ